MTTDGFQLHQKEIRLAQISVGIVAGRLQHKQSIEELFWTNLGQPDKVSLFASVFIGCHTVKWIPNILELFQVGDEAVSHAEGGLLFSHPLLIVSL